MTVTILVPIYGVERYISECVESLMMQTYPDIRYVFCNDATKDKSIEVLKETIEKFPERKGSVSIIENRANKGLGGTRQRLLEEIDGDAFAIVDSDDALPHDAIATLVKRMKESGADIVEGAYSEMSHGTLSPPVLPYHGRRKRYLRKLQCQNIVSHRVWGKLYRRDVTKRVERLFLEGIDYCEDLCATVRLAAVASRTYTDSVVYHYRTDNVSSYTKTVSEKSIRSYFKAQREILRFYHFLGHLPLSVEIGLMNSFRECHRSAISLQLADDIICYIPQNLTARLLTPLLRSRGVAYVIGDVLYRITRMIIAGKRHK